MVQLMTVELQHEILLISSQSVHPLDKTAFQILFWLGTVSVSLCLFLLVLITAHLAPADGKYAHHLWLMHGYKTLWR